MFVVIEETCLISLGELRVSAFRFMKVLITGICGFVGSSLGRRIKEAEPASEVFGIDNLVRPGSEINRRLGKYGIRVFHGDVRSATDIGALSSADWVIDA